MPIDASTDPYDPSGFDPATAKVGDLPGLDDDDIDLDDAGFGASGRAAVVVADDDEVDLDGGAKGPGTLDLGDDDDLPEGKGGADLDVEGAQDDAVDDGRALESEKLFEAAESDAHDDDDLDLDDIGTGAKLDPLAAGEDADDGDLLGKSGGLDGLDDDGDFKVDVGTDLGSDDDVDSDIGGRVGAGVGLDDDVDGEFSKDDDFDDDPDDPSDIDDGIFDFG